MHVVSQVRFCTSFWNFLESHHSIPIPGGMWCGMCTLRRNQPNGRGVIQGLGGALVLRTHSAHVTTKGQIPVCTPRAGLSPKHGSFYLIGRFFRPESDGIGDDPFLLVAPDDPEVYGRPRGREGGAETPSCGPFSP